MIRPISLAIALLGLALLVVHQSDLWRPLSQAGPIVDLAAALLLAVGIAGLLLYGVFEDTAAEPLEPRS